MMSEGAGALDHSEGAGEMGRFRRGFDQGEEDVSAVEDGDGQEVEEGEVDVEDDAEPEGLAPAVFVFEQDVVDAHDADKPGQVLGFDVGLGGEQGLEGADHGLDAGGDLVMGRGDRRSKRPERSHSMPTSGRFFIGVIGG
jgi:hypothetical protein